MQAHGSFVSGTLRRIVPAVLATVLGAVVGVGVPVAAPASAEEEYVACSWDHAKGQGSRRCGSATFDLAGAAVFSTCWKYKPSSKTYVQRRFGGTWYRQTENSWVSVTRSSSCPSGYPWRTKLTLGVYADEAFAIASYRLVMPATSQYKTTYFRVDACALPAYSDGVCR